MASKVRAYLDLDGNRFFNEMAYRRLEKIQVARLMRVPDSLKTRWRQAEWIFRALAHPYSRLVLYRVKRGRQNNAYLKFMRAHGFGRRIGIVPPPRTRRMQRPVRAVPTQAASTRAVPPSRFRVREGEGG